MNYYYPEQIFVRPTQPGDLEEIFTLCREVLAIEPNRGRITDLVTTYPSFVAIRNDQVIAFVYCAKFSPDILELANILVLPEFQNKGIGHKLVKSVEGSAVSHGFAAIILSNSMLSPTKIKKRNAKIFYRDLGYVSLFKTEHSTIFIKSLTK